MPFGAGATAAATKVALSADHVLVASVVIPILVRALPRDAVPADETRLDSAQSGEPKVRDPTSLLKHRGSI